MKQFRLFVKSAVLALYFLSICLIARAENPVRDVALITNGAGRIVTGVLSLPIEIIKGGVTSFPFGIIAGALRGTARTLSGVFGGGMQAASGAAPYAKYAAFL